MGKTPKQLPIIGWREWISLPDLGISFIKAKIDSGARSSSLHAYDVKVVSKHGEQWVTFKVHPKQRDSKQVVTCEAKLLEFRSVKSSSGKASRRPVILTNLSIMGSTFEIELTLANRDEMGFRMLLGREAFRRRFLVDAGASYLAGKN